MQYHLYTPNPQLAKYVKCYWSLECMDAGMPLSKERIFPDGCIEWVFHYADLFKKHTSDNTFHFQDRGFIHGQLKEFIEIEATGKIGIFSIRFHPNGLQPFIRFDVTDLTENTTCIADIWGHDGADLEDKVLNAKSNTQRVELVEQFLLGKLAKTVKNDALMVHCVNLINQSAGAVGIDELAGTLNIGKRQLERRFVAGVGISPKLFSRIVRFQNVLRLIEQKQFDSLTLLAYESGYYDQAHFIKDFKEFSGLNPKAYYAENLELVKLFNS